MRSKSFLLGSVMCLFISMNAKAACDKFIQTVADGRVQQISLSASQDVGLWFDGQQGHSYSVEVDDPNSGLASEFLGGAIVFCPGSNDSGVSLTNSNDPVINDSSLGFRGSFTATAPGAPYYVLHVVNGGTATTVNFSVSDTTMYNPRWSTFGGYTTQWGFQNTSTSAVTGNLIIKTTAGSVVSNTSFDVAPGVVVFKTTTGLSIGASQSGSATFTHNGPPGSILADAYMVNSNVTTVVPTKFETVRQTVH